MRGVVLGILASTALAFGSTAANAGITVNTCDSNLNSCSTSDQTIPIVQSKLAWEDSNVDSPTFSSTILFTNTAAGNYWVSVETSTPDILYTALSITPITGSGSLVYSGGPTPAITLLGPQFLGAGQYNLTFGGNSPNGGAASGSVTFRLSAVPEPATWAMMLLGFGAIGFAMRRRRRPALAQIA